MKSKRFVSGCAGLELSRDELSFFKEHKPWGLILFARNCKSRNQVRNLCESFRDAIDSQEAPILIDEEGGRVQRLKPPHWQAYPAAKIYGDIYEVDKEYGKRAAELFGQIIAYELRTIGITVNCVPVLDTPAENSSDVVGDRAFSKNTSTIVELAKSMSNGLLSGGVLPVMKHIPGHGRSLVDSHYDIPVVEQTLSQLKLDFEPFKLCRELPFAITAHVIYRCLDKYNPATNSPIVISEIIRNEIGYEGCLLSDDMSMNALTGTMTERARKILQAGCDILLHCNGNLAEMEEVASVSPELSGKSKERANMGLKLAVETPEIDIDKSRQEYQTILEKFKLL